MGTVSAENVYDAIAKGWRVMGPEEHAGYLAEKKYGSAGQGAIAAAEGLASGATAGLSEAGEKGLGLATQEDIEGRKRAHPIVSTAAGIGGAILPALVGEEASPAAMIAKGGGSLAEMLGEGMTAQIARGGFEAGVYGASQELSKQAFSGKPVEIDKVLSAAGTDALFGGGVGGLFGVLGAVGRKAAGFAGKGAAGAPGVTGATVDAVSDALESKAETDPTTLWGKVVGAMVGKEKSAALGRLTGDAAWRKLAYTTEDEADRLTVDGAQGITDLQKTFAAALNDVRNTIKPQEIQKGLAAVDPVAVRNAAFELSGKIDEAIAEMRSQPENYFDSAKIRQLEIQNESLRRVLKAEPIGITGIDPITAQPLGVKYGLLPGKTPAAKDIWEELDRMKDKFSTISKLGESVAATEQPAAAKINGIRKELLRPMMEDVNTWGSAAAAQAHYNSRIAEGLEATDRFNEFFGRKVGYSGGKPVFAVDPGKLKAFFGRSGDPANELPKAAFLNFLTKASDLGSEIANGNGALHQRLEAMLPGTADLARLAKARGDLGRIATQASEASGILGTSFGRAAVGHMLGGPLGAVAGLALTPATVPSVLHVLDRIVAGQDAKIAGLAKSIATGIRAAGTRAPMVTHRALEAARFTDRDYAAPARSSEEAFNRRASEIRALLADPAKRQAQAAKVLSTLVPAQPEAAKALIAQGDHAFLVLAAQLPPANPSSPLDPTHAPEPPNKIAQAEFADAVRVFREPTSVMDDLAHGRLSPGVAQTLRAMYPALHAQMASEILHAVSAAGKPMPYAKRLQFSMFMGEDLDPSLSQMSIAASQAQYAPPPAEGPDVQQAPKLQSTKGIESVKEVASGTQGLQMRAIG